MSRYRRVLSANSNKQLALYTEKLANYTKVLAFATTLLFIATLGLVFINQNLSESNENLTNVTTEFYRYHPPDVSLIHGSIYKLFVLRDNNSGTYLTLLGISSIYNSAQSDDIALIRQKKLGETIEFVSPKIKLIEGNLNTYNLNLKVNDTIQIEGNPFPIPVKPGEAPKIVPTSITYRMERILDYNTPCYILIKGNSSHSKYNHTFNYDNLTNQFIPEPDVSTCDLTIQTNVTDLEVLHPISKEIITNLTNTEPVEIKYVVGQNKAIVNLNHITYYINVEYTEDKETYQNWKIKFLTAYSPISFTI